VSTEKRKSYSQNMMGSKFILHPLLAEQVKNSILTQISTFSKMVTLKLGPFDVELNSAFNMDRRSECQEEMFKSAAHFTNFIDVPESENEPNPNQQFEK
jgi:hypothetical protein